MSAVRYGRDVVEWVCAHDPLEIVRWPDPATQRWGWDVRSSLAETYWLPVIGPSAVLMLRRLVDWLDTSETVAIALEDLSCTLGLGRGVSRQASVVRTLDRLVMFDMATIVGDSYAVRLAVPPLPLRFQRRLPGYLAERYSTEILTSAQPAPCGG